MIKLLHIIDSLGVGGAEKLLTGTINGLTDYEHHLIILKGPETLRPEIKVPYHFLNLGCTSFSQLFFKVPVVKKYIKQHNINLVHSHLYEANLLARLATPRSVRLINSIHSISSMASYKVNKSSLYLEKLSYKKRHDIIAVSHTALDDFRKWVGLRGRYMVIYNFIDEKYFRSAAKEKFSFNPLRLVAVGNLNIVKNYSFLLTAIKNLSAGVELDIYGEGVLRDKLQADIDKSNLPVKLCGLRNDLEGILPQYDAFIMASFYEGQPVSLLEAMACGIPAILSDIPVLREVCGNDAIYFDINNTGSLVSVIGDIKAGKYDLKKNAAALQSRANSFAHQHQFFERLKAFYAAE